MTRRTDELPSPIGWSRRRAPPDDGRRTPAGAAESATPANGAAQRVKLKFATWLVPSFSFTSSWRHCPTHVLSVFQT
jgi:hypothetical protein